MNDTKKFDLLRRDKGVKDFLKTVDDMGRKENFYPEQAIGLVIEWIEEIYEMVKEIE